MDESTFAPTPRTTAERLPDRASYERDLIYRILDEGLVCHVGFVVEEQPYVIPMNYARCGYASSGLDGSSTPAYGCD
jgi:nitroimidazol reductase NimA-like FMN-containing flavoprotein (pyridoxamine 5'-phosphate oxidase superfamily)